MPPDPAEPDDPLDRVLIAATADLTVGDRLRRWASALLAGEKTAGRIERPDPAPPATAAG